MKILKIKAYQLFANYRKPLNYGFIDSYPLPPLSTVKGWFHKVLDVKEYIPVSMCIQGNITSIVHDMQTLVKFRREGSIKLDDFGKFLGSSPTYVSNLYDINLNIYLYSDPTNLEKFKENVFNYDFPSLGRYEDLLRIDEIKFIDTDLKEFDGMMDNHELNYGIYLKEETAKNIGVKGINYRLNFKYEKIENIRYFNEKINVTYIDRANIDSGEFLIDNEDNRIIELIGDYG